MGISHRSTKHATPRLLALTLATALMSGCALISAPPGAAPMRYRDEIFSTVDTLTELSYGSAPGLNNETQDLRLDLLRANQTRYRIDPDRIAMAGIYVNLQPFADAGHVPDTQFRDRIVTQTVNFLYQQLHLDTAAI